LSFSQLGEYNTGFQVLNEAIDTTTANSELIFNIFTSLAQFEYSLLSERTRAGWKLQRNAAYVLAVPLPSHKLRSNMHVN